MTICRICASYSLLLCITKREVIIMCWISFIIGAGISIFLTPVLILAILNVVLYFEEREFRK